ncbi:NAD(P)H-dependent oxidoreductase [Rhodanobacter sp. DHG33]|uniref:NAD(P)H-dependent oxidoreductase n=1 Tax=Rhodanobacter sp. DHG33 TaxID=2775921 RepID=UPI00177E1915|nr:NAD(P)H-dependent oxidoreductase [Rhodanobacter sp. DHG33]MBD8898388.1 NAD(P)H-dependent oxidoreductase [Rhodanobacter sp. DHG33]
MQRIDKKKILIVHAHPERTSVTSQLAGISSEALKAQGHEVMESDLYAMGWKAVFDDRDFPVRANRARLSFIEESGHAFSSGCQTPDVEEEQRKLSAADAVILLFPLWWFGMPAIMKGWVDRVWAFGLAYGYQGAGNTYRYGEGGFAGKRALLAVSVGGPAEDYSPRGINGPLEQLLFPITHGTLFFPGMQVLPTFAVYGAVRIDAKGMADAAGAWRGRVERLFDDAPIAFRPQNGGDYPDRHVLASHVAPDQTGLMAHVADTCRVALYERNEALASSVSALET